MKAKRILLKGSILCIFTISIILFSTLSFGATFCVSNATELQTALTTAASNGENDTIQIVQGTYSGNFIYASTEGNSLTVEGGYTQGCASRTIDPTNTILDGGGFDTVLTLVRDGEGPFSVEGLTLQNGKTSTTNNGGGLYVRSDSNVTLTNNTFTANTANGYGGGVSVRGSRATLTITLTNNTFTGNTAQGSGGGIDVDANSVTLISNILTGNNAGPGYGGAGAWLLAEGVTLNNNKFSKNTNTGDGGGVYILILSPGGPVVLTNNIFTQNEAFQHGGGAWISGGNVILSTNIFDRNTCLNSDKSTWGGGIYVIGNPIILTDNIFSGNKTYSGGGGAHVGSGSALTDNTFIGNTVTSGYGGGCNGGDTLTDNTFTGNTATNGGGASVRDGSVVTNNTFAGNIAHNSGGGAFVNGNDTVLTNNTFTINTAQTKGGGFGIVLTDKEYRGSLYNNIIWNNTAPVGSDLYINNTGNDPFFPVPVDLFNNDFDQSASGTYIESPFTIDSSNLNNIDPLFFGGGNYHLSASSPCIDKGLNSAPSIPTTDKDGNPRTTDGTVDIGAYEYNSFAPIANAGSDQTVASGASVALDGSASSDPGSQTLTYLWTQIGGTIVTLSGATAIQPTFTAPERDPEGISLIFRLTATNTSGLKNTDNVEVNVVTTPTVTTTAVSSITATSATSGGNVTSEGGAPVTARGVCWSTSANPTTSDSKTTDGTGPGSFTSLITGVSPGTTYHVRAYATNSAGNAYGNDQTFVTSNSGVIIHIPSDYSTIQAGINAASNGDTVLVANGTYKGTGNKNIDFKGKAITVKSENGASSCIIDCEGEGQGFHFYSGEGADSLLSGFTITNGNSAGYGGGIDCRFSSSPTIRDCIINGNMGQVAGGGVAALHSSSPTITRCIISGNTGGSWAGGILCLDSSSPTITNCLITGNEVLGAGNGGGGIDCWYSSFPLIVNSTISGNIVSQFGGGIFSHDTSSPTVKNSIIWGNTPNQIQGFPSTVTYSDIQGGHSGEGNIDSDPLFLGNGDYHLTVNSPCIDAGTSNGAPDTDLAGTSRPQGNGYDMGAYEFVSSSSPPSLSTDTATSVTSSSATLNGTVNPNGASTTVAFEYGTTISYGKTVTATQSPLTGTTSQSVNAGVTGLTTGTTYHFRVKGTNSGGTTNGDDQTFTTTSGPPVTAPTVTTGSASTVTSTSATLNGTVNPNGSTTTYYFEYGTTTSYGETTSTTSAGSGTSDVSANASITGLTSETTYHYRVVATNSSGTSHGADEAFVTSSLKPMVAIGSGSGTRGDKITLPITLTNISGTDIAAVSVDIGYDTSVFEKPKATIGPAGDAADKTISTSEPSSGLFRITIFSISNNKVIGDGVVAYLTLDILANAPGSETTLTNTASASDPSGKDVVVESSDSTVTIIGFLAGDCNGDGTVSIAEVQSAINMYLEIIPVEECVDVNDNGKVSIGEVQKVINNHLDASLASDYTYFDPDSNISAEGIVSRLVNARSSSGVPLLDIGYSIGEPGKTVTVSISLANTSGYNIAAISCDISYDISVFEGATIAIGPAGSAAGKTVTSNNISSGVFRIGILSISNSNVIGDGVVAYLTFSVKADASLGQTTLGNSPEASDPSGNDVFVQGSNGAIRIAPAVYVQASGSCGGNTPCYSTIQAAIDAAGTGTVIKILQGTYDEDISFSSSKDLTLSGGWDSTFSTQTSTTNIYSLTIADNSGTVEIDNLGLQ